MNTILNYIVGYYLLAAGLSVDLYVALRNFVRNLILVNLSLLVLLVLTIYSRRESILVIAAVASSIVYLFTWYTCMLFGSIIKKVNNETGQAIKNLFNPLCTFSLMMAFTCFYACVYGFPSLATKQFTIVLSAVFFFTVYMVYNQKENKVPGRIMFALVMFMLFAQGFPEQYRYMARATYSSSQYAGAEADRYSTNRQADARGTFAYISEDGVLYDMQENETPMYVKTGQKVLILGIKNDLPEKETEPFVEIKLPNKYGAFVQSSAKYKYPRAKIGKFLMASDFDRREVPIEAINLKKGDNRVFSLKEKEATPWIEVPTGVQYNVATPKGCPFRLRFWNGQVHDVNGINEAPFVSPCKFKIINMAGKTVLCQLNGL